jgi:DNA-directed RNA polymerase specialized sigma24 family protein
VRDSAVAEEVTQEVFLKLYRHFDSAPDSELLRPWLLRVTLNEARNTIRGQSRAMARDTTYQKSTDETVTPSFEYENRSRWILSGRRWTRSRNQCAAACY